MSRKPTSYLATGLPGARVAARCAPLASAWRPGESSAVVRVTSKTGSKGPNANRMSKKQVRSLGRLTLHVDGVDTDVEVLDQHRIEIRTNRLDLGPVVECLDMRESGSLGGVASVQFFGGGSVTIRGGRVHAVPLFAAHLHVLNFDGGSDCTCDIRSLSRRSILVMAAPVRPGSGSVQSKLRSTFPQSQAILELLQDCLGPGVEFIRADLSELSHLFNYGNKHFDVFSDPTQWQESLQDLMPFGKLPTLVTGADILDLTLGITVFHAEFEDYAVQLTAGKLEEIRYDSNEHVTKIHNIRLYIHRPGYAKPEVVKDPKWLIILKD